jgi:hypothetical protein
MTTKDSLCIQEPTRHQALDPLHRAQGRRAEKHSQSGVRASAQGASWQLQALVQLSQGQIALLLGVQCF